jgi:hypothetical protein
VAEDAMAGSVFVANNGDDDLEVVRPQAHVCLVVGITNAEDETAAMARVVRTVYFGNFMVKDRLLYELNRVKKALYRRLEEGNRNIWNKILWMAIKRFDMVQLGSSTSFRFWKAPRVKLISTCSQHPTIVGVCAITGISEWTVPREFTGSYRVIPTVCVGLRHLIFI